MPCQFQCDSKGKYDLLLSRVRGVRWHIHHQGSGSSSVKEVDIGGLVIAVGGLQAAVEVRQQVDRFAIQGGGCKYARQGNTDIGLGVVANDDSIDKEGQEGILIGSSVILEKGSRVLVADRHGHISGKVRYCGCCTGSKYTENDHPSTLE